jgi:ABC-2 type transport system permease protein
MKVIDIALKDMVRYFRSTLAVGMMLVMPLLITGLIYFAFGSVLVTSETEAYTLPEIKIYLANLDRGDARSGANMGEVLYQVLTDENVKDVFSVTRVDDEESARGTVSEGEAALALIIPANFTQAVLSGGERAEVLMVQDPTLSFGPGITREILGQFLDALSGGRIAQSVAEAQFAARGAALNETLAAQIQEEYSAWFITTTAASDKSWNLPVVRRLPNRETPKSIADHRTTLMGPVFAGMMVFFVFFTGTNTAQTILREHEEGTLARLFTTPTPLSVALGGKFAAVFLTLIVQSVVLVAASGMLFQIVWGNLLSLSLMILGLVIAGAGFGIMLMAFLKSTRQAGAVVGGVLAIMGMAGGLYTQGFSMPPAFDMVSLSMPQGWAMRGFKLVLAGVGPQDVLVPLAVLVAAGLLFFIVGTWKFRTRFAS